MVTMMTNIFLILWLSVELMVASISFSSLLVICAPTHISHDMCENENLVDFMEKMSQKSLSFMDIKIQLLCKHCLLSLTRN